MEGEKNTAWFEAGFLSWLQGEHTALPVKEENSVISPEHGWIHAAVGWEAGKRKHFEDIRTRGQENTSVCTTKLKLKKKHRKRRKKCELEMELL